MDVLVIVLSGTVHVGLGRAAVRHAWPVLALGTAVEALREIRDRSPRLVVVQVSTLNSEPLKLIRMLRHCSQPVLIVAVANSHRTQLEQLVRDAGASCYLPAADDESQLVQTVASMLDYALAHAGTGTTNGSIAHLDPRPHSARRGAQRAHR